MRSACPGRIKSLAAIGLSAIGLGLSIYSAWHHLKVHVLGVTDALCNLSRLVNCDRVALSAYSEWAGVPLGVWAAAYFISQAVLLFRAGRVPATGAGERLLLSIQTTGGVLAVFWFAWIANVRLHSLCLVCSLIHLIVLLQAGLTARILWSAKTAAEPALYLPKTWSRSVFLLVYPLLGVIWWGGHSRWEKRLRARYVRQAESLSHHGLEGFVEERTFSIPLSPLERGGDDLVRGSLDAPVVLTEFLDFTCPVCGVFSGLLARLEKEFGTSLTVAFKYSPLEIECNPGIPATAHEHACFAARAAFCLARQGVFWKLSDRLFALDYTDEGSVARALGKTGADLTRLKNCERSAESKAKIERDTTLAARLRVTATPAIYLNGRRFLVPLTYENLEAAVRLLIKEKGV